MDCFICSTTAWLFFTVAVIYFILRWVLWQLTIGDYDKRYVLITGCDMGFGNLLAKRLSSMGFNVFAGCLMQKGISDLHELGHKKLTAFQLDVTKKEDILRAKNLVKELLPRETGLWALVNNAGILGPLAFPDCCCREDYEKVLNVNMYGTIEMTMAFLPLIREAEGRIVNVASVSGKVSLPTCIPYNISKYAVEAFSDGLRCSLKNQNVSVHILEPGLHGTNIIDPVIIEKQISRDFHSASPEVQDYYGENCLKNFETKLETNRRSPDLRSNVTMSMTIIMNPTPEEGRMNLLKCCVTKNNQKDVELLPNDTWYVCKLMVTITSSRLYCVINAHVHAITAKFPKTRYLIGTDANLIFWPLSMLPTWIGDLIIQPRFIYPNGLKKKKMS